MKVLHICSSYPYTSLYKNLLLELDNRQIDQIMYVPLMTTNLKNKRMLDNPKHTQYIFSDTYKKFDRYFYFRKINKIYEDIKAKIILNQIDLIHAHFLFSNGGIACKLKEEYGLDYIVAVRNTDVNYFFKYGLHLRKYGIKILKEAKKIVFLSPAYKDYVIRQYIPEHLKENIINKSYVIPNGIDNYWIENCNDRKKGSNNSKHISLIFVGELNKNKNIYNSVKAANNLKEKGYEVQFDIIGEGPYKEKIKDYIKSTGNENNFKLHGYINDKKRLIQLYRSADIFLMPSFKETFGLVYIEAMSQGLPVIYSKGQGIDGYFKDGEVGFSVSPENTDEIVLKIETLIKDYGSIYQNLFYAVSDFKWSQIADEYIEIYQ